jgi:hypothetical protein
MAQRSRKRAVSLAEALELHARHERILTTLGSDYSDGIAAPERRVILRMAHQKQRLLQRAGLLPTNEIDPTIGG